MNKKLLIKTAVLSCMLVILGVLPVSAAGWTENLNDGLVAYYNLDETGGNAVENVNGIYNGTNINMQQGLPGRVGNSYNETAIDSEITVSTLPVTTFPITFNAWVNIRNDDVHVLSAHACSGNADFRIGGQQMALGKCGVDEVRTGAILYPLNTWIMATWVYNGINVTSYINGLKVGNVPGYTRIFTQGNMHFGKNQDPTGNRMMMDELAIYNRSLTAEEVSQLYNNGEGMTYLICTQNSDCGSVSVERMCIGNDVIDRTTTPTCTLGGCSNPTTDATVQTCSYQCANGSCIHYSYWAMENYTYGGEKYPMLSAYSTGVFGNIGAIKNGLYIINNATETGFYSALNFYDADSATLAVLFWDGINLATTQSLIVNGDITGYGENIIGNNFIGKSYDAQTYYSVDGNQGISASGASCTITEIKGGIITGATC